MLTVPDDKYKDTYREEYTVMAHDTDARYRIRPSIYLRYMQETANHQMRDCKPTYNELYDEGKSFVLSRVHVEILQQLRQYDRISVQTWPSNDRGVTFTRSYRIIRDGEVVALGSSAWALLDLKNKGFIRCDGELLNNYYHADKLEGLPLRFPMPRVAFEYKGTRKVYYNDTDINLHMNNTNYPDVLTDFLDDTRDRELRSMIIGYASEAKLGSEMNIYTHTEETDDGSINYVRSLIDGNVNIEARFIYGEKAK